MSYEFPLVFFTTFTQLAVGVSCFAAFKAVAGQPSPVSGTASEGDKKDWLLVCAAVGIGLVASVFHLGQPLRAPTALRHLAEAWLSREILAFGLFAALAFLTLLSKPSKNLVLLTSAVGVAGVVVQGFTYAPVSMPAIANGLPFVFFAVTALVCGAAFARPPAGKTYLPALWAGLGLFILMLLTVPGIWLQGGTVMRTTASAWQHSPLYWTAVLLAVFAFSASKKSLPPSLVCVLVFVGVLVSRMVFFGSTIHTATNLGSLY